MKFTHSISFYKLNDDNTITFFVQDESGKKYFRANARLPILNYFSNVETGECFLAELGIYYDRGRGLQIQIIEIK